MLVVEVCAQSDQLLDKGQRAPIYCIFERMIPDRQLERLTTVGKIPRIIQRLPQCINVPHAIRVVRSLVLARDLERVSGHIGNLAASLNPRDRDHAVGMVQKQITVWRIGELSARAPQPLTTTFRNALAVDGAALVDLGWNIPKNTKGRDVSLLIKAVIAMARDIATAVDSAGLLRRRRRRWRKWRSDKGKDGVS